MPHGGTHPLAHEGNPREDEITISSGSVLSTATLEVEFPLGDPIEPEEFFPGTVRFSGSSADKWSISEDFAYGNDITAAIASTAKVAVGGTIKEYSKKGGTPLYGLMQRECTFVLHDQDGGHVRQESNISHFYKYGPFMLSPSSPSGVLGMEMRMECRVSEIVGGPISGPAVAILPKSNKEDFTGLAYVWNGVKGRLELRWYVHASLRHEEDGEIIATHSVTPDVADFLYLSAHTSNTFGAGSAVDISAVLFDSDASTVRAGGTFLGLRPSGYNDGYLETALNYGVVNIGSHLSAQSEDSITYDRVRGSILFYSP